MSEQAHIGDREEAPRIWQRIKPGSLPSKCDRETYTQEGKLVGCSKPAIWELGGTTYCNACLEAYNEHGQPEYNPGSKRLKK